MNKNYYRNRGRISIRLLMVFSTLALVAQTGYGQNTSAPAKMNQWDFLVEPYLMATSMSGNVGMGNLPNTFVCIPASEVFSHLTIGGMLYFEAHNDQFAISSDFLYASLKQDASGKYGVINGSLTVKQLMWELAGLYRVLPWLEFGVGARLTNLDCTAEINVDSTLISGPQHKSGNQTQSWVDPIIITRLKTIRNNRWILQLRADIGGFGIGSQLTWQLHPEVDYKFSKLFQAGIAYRVLSNDYNKGSGSDRFLYDIDMYGPEIRLGFNF